jgi:tRNA nucleotidyltransferase (CCA-adding enzyme)
MTTNANRADTGWEHYAHDADIGVRGFGPTREAAFEQAAHALTAVVAEPETIAARETVAVACAAGDDDSLLYDWLNALGFEMATRGMLFARFEVAIAEGRLSGTAWGEAVERHRHRPAAEIKGATYTDLRVACGPDGRWVAQCVVDV